MHSIKNMSPWIAIVFGVAWAHAAAAKSVTLTPLGDLPGGFIKSVVLTGSADGEKIFGWSYPESNRPTNFVWTQQTGILSLDLPEPFDGTITGTSADGLYLTGYFRQPEVEGNPVVGFRWSLQDNQGQLLGFLPGRATLSEPTAISDDGSTIVGIGDTAIYNDTFYQLEAFRWTKETGILGLGFLEESDESLSVAHAVSADGSVVVGGADKDGRQVPFRWTQQTGMTELGPLPEHIKSASAVAVSADGRVVAGDWVYDLAISPTEFMQITEAFRWTAETGYIPVGYLGNEHPILNLGSFVTDISADGSIVLGYVASSPLLQSFIWDPIHGVRYLDDILTDAGIDLSYWTNLAIAEEISADGTVIIGSGVIGHGIRPDGWIEGWRMTIPEPASVALWLTGGLIYVTSSRRRARCDRAQPPTARDSQSC